MEPAASACYIILDTFKLLLALLAAFCSLIAAELSGDFMAGGFPTRRRGEPR